MTLFPLTMVSDWMEHGTILQFVKRNKATNRLKLVCILGYLEHTLIYPMYSYMMSHPDWSTSIASHLSIQISRVWVSGCSHRIIR